LDAYNYGVIKLYCYFIILLMPFIPRGVPKQLLNWQPQALKAEGLKITYGYFKLLLAEEI